MNALNEVNTRIAGWEGKLYSLSYERFTLEKRREEIDSQINQLEAAINAAKLDQKDLITQLSEPKTETKPVETPTKEG
jgi:chromosome segregation ATPase